MRVCCWRRRTVPHSCGQHAGTVARARAVAVVAKYEDCYALSGAVLLALLRSRDSWRLVARPDSRGSKGTNQQTSAVFHMMCKCIILYFVRPSLVQKAELADLVR